LVYRYGRRRGLQVEAKGVGSEALVAQPAPRQLTREGSRACGVAKQSGTCGPAAGILFGSLPGCRKDRSAHSVRGAGIGAAANHAGNPGDYVSQAPSDLGVPPMSEVTRILSAIDQGDPQAAEQLLPLVYEELRRLAAQKLAHEKPGQTLDATALVHEAYLRLVDSDQARHWNSRGHFFAAAAEAMRRILVEKARNKKRLKRGGDQRRIGLADPRLN